VSCSELQCVTACLSMLQCVVVCCSMLHHGLNMPASATTVFYVVVRCSEVQ